MTCKYSDWSRGQDEALLNKLGGEEVAMKLLSCRQVTVTFDDSTQIAKVVGVLPMLDCTKLFDPTDFIGKDWKELERDERAYALTQVDFSRCQFLSCLKEGEGHIKGEERLRRLKKDHSQLIRLGGNQFLALWEDYQKNGDNSVLEHLRLTQGITYLNFPGLILQNPSRHRNVLYLRWRGGHWRWRCSWLDNEWNDRGWSSVSPAS